MEDNALVSNKIKQMLSRGEGQTLEFKECGGGISKTVYETVCAFLNTKGGSLLFGVNDSAAIAGIPKDIVEKIKQDFVNAVNNKEKLSPTFCLSVEEAEIDGKILLHIYVPESSQVHRCNGRIFIRNNSGDFDITDKHAEVSNLYLRKQSSYSENNIFPAVTIRDLSQGVIEKARNIAAINNSGVDWAQMSDIDFLKHTGLYQKNLMTGKEGFTLAAVLLFGKDEFINMAVPAFKIDMIKRVENTERYDDRLDLRTNLIDAYEKAMEFVSKHLPDPFYMEQTERINLRENIFREVIQI